MGGVCLFGFIAVLLVRLLLMNKVGKTLDREWMSGVLSGGLRYFACQDVGPIVND